MEKTQPKRGLKATEKLLIGCGLGCGVLLVGVLAAGGFGALWFFSPGEQVETERIVSSESQGVVRMNELATDPGTQALITKAVRTLTEVSRRQQEQALPESMRWLQALQRSPSARDFNRFIPKEATLIIEPNEAGDEASVVAAVNFRTMVRPIKTMIAFIARSEGMEELGHDYRGYAVYNFDGDAYLAFVDSTLLISDAASSLERAIDRIEDDPTGGGERMAGRLPDGRWDAAGSLNNDAGAVVAVLRELLDDASLEAPAGGAALELRFGSDVVSADEVSARAHLDCADAAHAEAWLDVLEERFPELRGRAAERGLELELVSVVDGSSVVTEIRLTGLESWIETSLDLGALEYHDER